jgi:hypothetical protein
MHPFHFAAACWLAGFACLSLGKVPPRNLRWRDARFIVSAALVVVGMGGCAALAAFEQQP